MQRLNKRTGMTLIEIACALGIMSIFCLTIVTFQLNNLRLASLNKHRLTCITALEAIKEEMLNNASYNDIVGLGNHNKKYVSIDKLSLSSIKSSSLEQIFSESYIPKSSYIVLSITPGDVLKLELELHVVHHSAEEVIHYAFYKGNYL
jgi:hypothetical protein